MIKINYASFLNPEQLEAVFSPPSPVLVIAGAGSGKTRTLTYRVAYLIENGVAPQNILLMTFTNKAAREMLERVANLLPHDITGLWGGTFHHIANRLLRRHASILGLDTQFTILDREDCKQLIQATLKELGWDKKDTPKPELLLELQSLSLNKCLSLDQLFQRDFPHLEKFSGEIQSILRAYQNKKRKLNAVDYDDLLVLALQLLRENSKICEHYQLEFQHILVDEYQDTNKIQSDFIDTLASAHKQLMVVGDDAQSIYSWRGANFKNILTFLERYPNARKITIHTNYRSTPQILAVANASIAHNRYQFKKELHSHIRDGAKPVQVVARDGREQALFIAQALQHAHERGQPWSEMAVLYRSHFHAMELQLELTRARIPFQITSGLRFFEQMHIKDVAAFLKLAVNRSDELSFHRVAKMMPGIGEKSARRMWKSFVEGKPLNQMPATARSATSLQLWHELDLALQSPELRDKPAEQIKLIVERFYRDYIQLREADYMTRLEDLVQLQSFAEQFQSTTEFLAQMALLTNGDENAAGYSDDGRRVRLSTIHQAKGLEWNTVFIIMLCDGLFPSAKSLEQPETLEEERRLFYVAITRARRELYLIYPMMRSMGSNHFELWQKPSRFLEEIPPHLIETITLRRA
ncbi:MAG: UvrD-helicase domain-containing protein [Methylacidiphilales bacterium]|nr:UvrD-helicase domain-containing protein [Candidatus Methylacidiphilales bacterium]MDW8348745.1 UvrD-helicase domain-containing protein [Verrucomicrobiae bacterium]